MLLTCILDTDLWIFSNSQLEALQQIRNLPSITASANPFDQVDPSAFDQVTSFITAASCSTSKRSTSYLDPS